MWPVSVSFSVPDARSQILIVRSPAPDANHWFPGSMASARTQPRWPDITRMSFHGGCHSGFCCRTVSLRTKLEPGRFLCGVGPFAFGGSFVPEPLARSVRAVEEEEKALDGAKWADETPSIILAILGSLACSSVFGFFRRASAEAAAAFACFAARAAGSSLTSAYSCRIRAARLAFCALSEGEGRDGAIAGCGNFSRAEGAPKSAANTSRVRLADWCTNCEAGATSAIVLASVSLCCEEDM